MMEKTSEQDLNQGNENTFGRTMDVIDTMSVHLSFCA